MPLALGSFSHSPSSIQTLCKVYLDLSANFIKYLRLNYGYFSFGVVFFLLKEMCSGNLDLKLNNILYLLNQACQFLTIWSTFLFHFNLYNCLTKQEKIINKPLKMRIKKCISYLCISSLHLIFFFRFGNWINISTLRMSRIHHDTDGATVLTLS